MSLSMGSCFVVHPKRNFTLMSTRSDSACACLKHVHTSAVYTSVKIIKNEVGCRDDTVPKTVDTRRHCEEE